MIHFVSTHDLSMKHKEMQIFANLSLYIFIAEQNLIFNECNCVQYDLYDVTVGLFCFPAYSFYNVQMLSKKYSDMNDQRSSNVMSHSTKRMECRPYFIYQKFNVQNYFIKPTTSFHKPLQFSQIYTDNRKFIYNLTMILLENTMINT